MEFEQNEADALALSLQHDKSKKTFWQRLKTASYPISVSGISGARKVLKCGEPFWFCYIEHVILQFISSHLQTSENQFGFKAKHGTDLCTFLLKQTIASYVNQNTPVYGAFLDASKACDRVNYAVLFNKLIARDVPMCFVRLLQFWYSHQSRHVARNSQWGLFWGQKPPEARGSGGSAPSARKFCIFLQK